MERVDGAEVAASLAARLERVTFTDLNQDEVTALLGGAVADWGTGHGWRVYRRAASVFPLPPPYHHRRSILDVALARPDGPPVAVEIDHTDRRRSVDKLLAEAAAGRIAVWLRWGRGPFEPPPAPVWMVTCEVTARRGVYSRVPPRPAPGHSPSLGAVQQDLFDSVVPES